MYIYIYKLIKKKNTIYMIMNMFFHLDLLIFFLHIVCACHGAFCCQHEISLAVNIGRSLEGRKW